MRRRVVSVVSVVAGRGRARGAVLSGACAWTRVGALTYSVHMFDYLVLVGAPPWSVPRLFHRAFHRLFHRL